MYTLNNFHDIEIFNKIVDFNNFKFFSEIDIDECINFACTLLGMDWCDFIYVDENNKKSRVYGYGFVNNHNNIKFVGCDYENNKNVKINNYTAKKFASITCKFIKKYIDIKNEQYNIDIEHEEVQHEEVQHDNVDPTASKIDNIEHEEVQHEEVQHDNVDPTASKIDNIEHEEVQHEEVQHDNVKEASGVDDCEIMDMFNVVKTQPNPNPQIIEADNIAADIVGNSTATVIEDVGADSDEEENEIKNYIYELDNKNEDINDLNYLKSFFTVYIAQKYNEKYEYNINMKGIYTISDLYIMLYEFVKPLNVLNDDRIHSRVKHWYKRYINSIDLGFIDHFNTSRNIEECRRLNINKDSYMYEYINFDEGYYNVIDIIKTIIKQLSEGARIRLTDEATKINHFNNIVRFIEVNNIY